MYLLAFSFHEARFSVISFFVHPVLTIILSRHRQGRANRFLVGGGGGGGGGGGV
jgi:hypothetical protein